MRSDKQAVLGLRQVLSGRVVTPADPDWEQVRRAWNLSVDQQPLAVVEAAGPSDVEHTVTFAAAHGLKVAAQTGGHGATRALDDTIVLRTNALDDVWVDSHARIARSAPESAGGRCRPHWTVLG